MTKRDVIWQTIGERFGSQIAQLIGTCRIIAVTVESIDEENNVAYTTLYGEGDPLSVPLTSTFVQGGAVTVIPNVGSLALVAMANGNEATPFFVNVVDIDTWRFSKGETLVEWRTSPAERDEDGELIEVSDPADAINVSVGASSIRIDKDVVEFNGGELNGLVVVGKLTERLNTLQAQINSIQTAIAKHRHSYVDSIGSAATPMSRFTTSTQFSSVSLQEFKDSDYVNDKITQ